MVRNEILDRKRQAGVSIQKGELHDRIPCSLEESPLEETSIQEDCNSKLAKNLVRKYASASRKLNWVLCSCEGVRDTKDHMFIVYSGASMHNAEQ